MSISSDFLFRVGKEQLQHKRTFMTFLHFSTVTIQAFTKQ